MNFQIPISYSNIPNEPYNAFFQSQLWWKLKSYLLLSVSKVFDGTLKLHKLPYEHLMEVLQSRFEIFIQDNLLSLPSHFQPFLKQIFFSLFKL